MNQKQLAENLKNPVFAVVYEAVKAFSRRERRTDDFRIWLWYCHRIGYNTLLQQMIELEQEMATNRLEGRAQVRNPAALFHRRLKEIYLFHFRENNINPRRNP